MIRYGVAVSIGLFAGAIALDDVPQISVSTPEGGSACGYLSHILPHSVYYPTSPTYLRQQSTYWSAQQSELHPTCLFLPSSTDETHLGLRVIVATNTTFAIRSGGHSSVTGASNAGCHHGCQGGASSHQSRVENQDTIQGAGSRPKPLTRTESITFDLSLMNVTQITGDGSEVWVSTGARWGDVYRALEAYDPPLTVSGGRVADVGVGGYVLGGGMSWFANEYGWTCDSVVEFEVVTACPDADAGASVGAERAGGIVRANAAQNADLFWALKGSLGAFGIVTKIKVPAIRLAPTGVWGGAIGYEEQQVPDLLHALEAQNARAEEEVETTGYLSFAWIEEWKRSTFVAYLINNRGKANGKLTRRWTGIPHTYSNLRMMNMSTSAEDINEGNVPGFRVQKFTLTIKNSFPAMHRIYTIFQIWLSSATNTTDPPFFDANSTLGITFQPITVPHLRASSNIFTLEPSDGPLILLSVELRWTDPRKDNMMASYMRAMGDEMYVQLNEGWVHPWVYPNYAARWQDPFDSSEDGPYGADEGIMERLRGVKTRWDPEDVFGRLRPGAFHAG